MEYNFLLGENTDTKPVPLFCKMINYVQTNINIFMINENLHLKNDLHLHLPKFYK